MGKLDAHERLRRAAELLASEGAPEDAATLLFQAWEYLKGLRGDDFPEEFRPAFHFLEHEFLRAEGEEFSAREINFLAGKIRKLESMWIENAEEMAEHFPA